jgi:hypothetical protein
MNFTCGYRRMYKFTFRSMGFVYFITCKNRCLCTCKRSRAHTYTHPFLHTLTHTHTPEVVSGPRKAFSWVEFLCQRKKSRRGRWSSWNWLRTTVCPSATCGSACHLTGAVNRSALAFPFLAPERDREIERETERKVRREGGRGGGREGGRWRERE